MALASPAPAPKAAPFDLNALRNLQETRYPELKAKRLAAEKAAADKAAYDAIPYATHLANAQAELAKAKEAQAAWKPAVVDTSKMTAAQQATAKAIANVPGLVALSNPTIAQTKAAEGKVQNLIKGHLQDQLSKQATGYGFGWKGNKSADYHTATVADLLRSRGITDLTQLGYSKDGKNLINKETGAIVPWHKNKKGNYDVGQLGWSAKGKGLTKYKVQPDAQGNPVLFPQWKSNAPGGLGGFLLKAAPVLTSFIPGVGALGAAAINAGLTAAQGGGIGDILKSGALSYAGAKIAPTVSNAITANIPTIVNPTITSAIADATGGAASGATRAAIQGKDILSGAGTGALAGGIGSLATSAANAVPTNVTGTPIVDRNLASLAGGTTAGVLQGKDPLNALLGAAVPIAGKEISGVVTSAIPDTGNVYVDSLVNAAVGAGTKIGLNELLSPNPSALPPPAAPPVAAVAPPTATPTAPTTPVAVAPAAPPAAESTGGLSNNYLALFPLLAASMSQRQEAPVQQLAQLGSPLDLNKLFDWPSSPYGGTSLYAKGGNVSSKQSMQQLLALLRSSGKIA